MRSVVCFLAAFVAVSMQGSSALAIIGGEPDGNAHPYVGYVTDGNILCSGSLLSPTVLLTAAHCFSTTPPALGTNTVTGAPLIAVTFVSQGSAPAFWYIGTYYIDPDYAELASPGHRTQTLPKGFTRVNDAAIVVFTPQGCVVPAIVAGASACGPIPPDATLGQYGQLPTPGLIDTLPKGTSVDIVGFGFQGWANGGGVGTCDGRCKRFPDRFELDGTRYFAQTTLSPSNDVTSSQFIKLSASKAGICGGDSGGPDLLTGTNIILAMNSYINQTCESESGSYRVDTPHALNWIQSAADAYAGHL